MWVYACVKSGMNGDEGEERNVYSKCKTMPVRKNGSANEGERQGERMIV